MKKFYLSIFIITCLIDTLSAQRNSTSAKVKIAGVVFDAYSLHQIPNVKCHYKNKFIKYADSLGTFSFNVKKGDTVYFSCIGYNTSKLVIDNSLKNRDYIVGVYLSRDTIMLSEVIVVRRTRRDIRKIRESLATTTNKDMELIMLQIAKDKQHADMNTESAIDDFSYYIMNKGHVDVRFGIGRHTVTAINELRKKARKPKDTMQKIGELKYEEFDALKKVFLNK